MSVAALKTIGRIARYSNVRRAKVAAVAMTRSGHIIAHAHNRRIDGHRRSWTQHAEEALLIKLNKLCAFQRFGILTVLVARVGVNGFTMAKPCGRCQSRLAEYPVNVYYTTDRQSIVML